MPLNKPPGHPEPWSPCLESGEDGICQLEPQNKLGGTASGTAGMPRTRARTSPPFSFSCLQNAFLARDSGIPSGLQGTLTPVCQGNRKDTPEKHSQPRGEVRAPSCTSPCSGAGAANPSQPRSCPLLSPRPQGLPRAAQEPCLQACHSGCGCGTSSLSPQSRAFPGFLRVPLA